MLYANRQVGIMILGLFLVFAWPFGQAFSKEHNSFFATTCSNWNTLLDEMDRFVYILGLRDGLIFSGMIIQGIELPDMSTREAAQGVDWLCNDPANMKIAVPFVLKVVGMRALGMSQETVDDELSEQRALFQVLGQ